MWDCDMIDCRRLVLFALLSAPIALGAQTATSAKEPLRATGRRESAGGVC
jgi:hypothetical protein